jgi:hypothetical protein
MLLLAFSAYSFASVLYFSILSSASLYRSVYYTMFYSIIISLSFACTASFLALSASPFFTFTLFFSPSDSFSSS